MLPTDMNTNVFRVEEANWIPRPIKHKIPSIDAIQTEEPPHYHLLEYHLDECINDIIYRHYRPAQWTQDDIVTIWRVNNYKVHRIQDEKLARPELQEMVQIYRYEVHSFGDIIIREVRLKECCEDCFSIESFEKWWKDKKNDSKTR